MPCYLCCISSPTGIPLMCKKKGDIANLPFPIQAALNGAFVFGKSFDVHLQSLETDTCLVTWKDFHESVTVIVISERSPGGEFHVRRLMETVWDAMVLCVGWDDLANIANVERVKRQLKGCYRLVDRLLAGLEDGLDTFCDLTGLPDVLLLPRSSKLQMALESVTEAADSTYGCLLVRGRLAAATRNWQLLSSREQCLLALYVTAARGSASARDVSIYLPVKSPHVPFRLLVCRLSEWSEVAVLCGPTPSLEELERAAVRHWAPVLETVRQHEVALPRAVPASLPLDPALLSFVLESSASGRCVCSPCPGRLTSAPADTETTLRRLRAFYRLATGELMCNPAGGGGAAEVYITTDQHHCYALRCREHSLYALFQHGTPPHLMRGLTQAALQQLTSIKQVRF